MATGPIVPNVVVTVQITAGSKNEMLIGTCQPKMTMLVGVIGKHHLWDKKGPIGLAVLQEFFFPGKNLAFRLIRMTSVQAKDFSR